ncbi:organic solute transporter subunit alpha-like isoform X2 [Aquila chrysaetos chrysaetos]|uniref:organic solute transporter subunit alpha-like isoform X2 n=1 Tax=Aquila chrysaetos chrysaetos TaxID=223781 RepID=UPI00117717F0|nr:organic solute transporter subunit alpha-like isoform X2 [Aquila chrysaetos chrysaetos]
MEGETNGTLHPESCGSGQPPYSRELLQSLDLPGRFLFAVLTLMTLIANLVFIEEAVYIYRRIPSFKRSVIIWINAAAPVIATTSCIGMWIPRSTMFTDFTAAVFFAIVIHKFLMMMIKECGGQKLLLKRFENGHFKISTGPCCCCCLCLPRVRITRRTLFWLKLGTFQFAFLRPVLMFLSIVLWTNGNYTLYNFILILNHLQAAIINILAMQRIIPCAPPLSSSARGAYMTQQLLIMEMFLITLISRVVYRRRYRELEPPERMAEESEANKQTPKIILNGAVNEDGLPRF